MKYLLILVVIFSFVNCDRKKTHKTQSEFEQKNQLETIIRSKNKKDTINNYWALIYDTISSIKEFKISESKYTLELKTYSLNDSSIVRNLALDEEQPYLDHSHKVVTDFKLFTDSHIDIKQIDRRHFEKFLIPEFYMECNLHTTKIDSVKGNTIYLNSSLDVPDTDNVWTVWYSMNINNNRLSDLNIQETKYVGL